MWQLEGVFARPVHRLILPGEHGPLAAPIPAAGLVIEEHRPS
jgi:hypothetical protein